MISAARQAETVRVDPRLSVVLFSFA
jgi:hypothetical protein